jgi:hypothetical protein
LVGAGGRFLELFCCYRDAAKKVKELFANVARPRLVEPTLAAKMRVKSGAPGFEEPEA